MSRRSNSVTIRDVAKRAGVSVATVSRYINNSAPVSKEVGDRLESVMAELRYVPHSVARNLATRKTWVVGLLLTNLHNDFFAPLLAGIESVVRENQYNLLVATCRGKDWHGFSPPVGPHNSDGLLVYADSLSNEYIEILYEKEFPFVLIHRTPPKSMRVPSVTVENRNASRKIVEHLIEVHGKRRIIFMRGPLDQEDSYWREQGYQTALITHGIAVDPALILDGGFEREIAYANFKQYLEKTASNSFDAVFTGDDDAAIGVLDALQEVGCRVPEDVAVVGFDDSRMSPFLDPPLTTVRAPTEEVGRVATQRLFNLLSNADQSYETTLLSTEIVIRQSCGCNQDIA
jgi:DNA-binding LacI/PurR family transcriptional regulator